MPTVGASIAVALGFFFAVCKYRALIKPRRITRYGVLEFIQLFSFMAHVERPFVKV